MTVSSFFRSSRELFDVIPVDDVTGMSAQDNPLPPQKNKAGVGVPVCRMTLTHPGWTGVWDGQDVAAMVSSA